jgi:SAM-dependent methyltransferase
VHAHHDGTHIDWDALGTFLENGADLRAPGYEQAVGWLRELTAEAGVHRILDVGSGPGVVTCLLARGFPEAEVVAVDGAPALLERARTRAGRQGLTDRVHTRRADLPDDLNDLGDADLLWISQALHHLGDQQAMLGQLAGRLRPGGLLALVEGGLPTRFLPRDTGLGRPGLQARLDAATEDWFTEMRAALPGVRAVVEDWPTLLAAAGLVPVATRTFLVDRAAPLPPDARAHLHADLARLRDLVGERLDAEDHATLGRLLDPDDEAGLMRRADVFLLTAKTVHIARAGAAAGE